MPRSYFWQGGEKAILLTVIECSAERANEDTIECLKRFEMRGSCEFDPDCDVLGKAVERLFLADDFVAF